MQGYELIGLTKEEFAAFAALRTIHPHDMNPAQRVLAAKVAKAAAAHATALNSTAAERASMKRVAKL